MGVMRAISVLLNNAAKPGMNALARTLAAGLCASAWLVSDGNALAQEAPVTRVDDIVVEGRRLTDMVDDFVDEVIAPPVGRGPARWNRRVCVGAVNFQRAAGQALIDQVSSVALRMGLEVGEPGCQPNVLIIGTDDGPGLASALVAARPRLFRPGWSGAVNSRALDAFTDSDAAVRWWHISLPVQGDTGAAAVRMPGGEAPLVNNRGGRLRTEVRNDLQKVFVIIDLPAAEGRDFAQLGDYVGMVALAQVAPDADTAGYDTVLNLFSPDALPGLRLTEWDVSFLGSLYDAELNARQARSQLGEVVDGMVRDRVAAGRTD